MRRFILYLAASLLSFTVSATVDADDFRGSGYIVVLNSSDYSTATPNDEAGCLDADGHFSVGDCAVFTRLDDYPYTISSTTGNCTFAQENHELNTDSKFKTPAFYCLPDYEAEASDSVFSVTGFNYLFLCSGDYNCYFDSKAIPPRGKPASIWQYKWGSPQMGITPGHLKMMWLWLPLNGTKI